ncbi:DNA-directed RNA polymerase subunit alpha C-terminal domain-containing protein [Planomonospora algeriensis]
MSASAAAMAAATGQPDRPLTDLPGLTWHATKPLTQASIRTIGDLAGRADDDLLRLPQFGQRRLDALKTALALASEGVPSR